MNITELKEKLTMFDEKTAEKWIEERISNESGAVSYIDVIKFIQGARYQHSQDAKTITALLEIIEQMQKVLETANKRFSHIENWHRDYVTPDNFKDCQDIGLTPESYLRDGKIECRQTITATELKLKELGEV